MFGISRLRRDTSRGSYRHGNRNCDRHSHCNRDSISRACAGCHTCRRSNPAATTAVIPANVVGMNAQALEEELEALGFKKVIFNSDTGKTVLLLSNWTVTGIDNPGTEQATTKSVVVHVTK